MTHANALKGTWMGRQVKTEAEVLEECANYHSSELSVEVPSTEPISSSTVSTSIPLQSRIEQISKDTFQFMLIPYQGRMLHGIQRKMHYLDWGKEKSQQEHLEWLADPRNNPSGLTMADMELEYQMLRISFELRDHPTFGAAACAYIIQIRELCDKPIVTADHIQYLPGGLEAVITNKGNITAKSEKRTQIPAYTKDCAILSTSRPESQLDQTQRMAVKTRESLKVFLGHGYEQAGAVFSYCASRKNGKLRRTQLWTPGLKDRTLWPLRFGGFGVDDCDELGISLDHTVAWRALGVEKIFFPLP